MLPADLLTRMKKYIGIDLRQPIPVAGNRHVTGNAQAKDNIRKADRIAVAQHELTITIDSDRVDAIIVPVSRHRLIARDAIVDLDIGKTRDIRVLQVQGPIA